MKKRPLSILFLGFSFSVFAQMPIGSDTLFGNEWIDFSKTYYRINVAEDGIYRIPAATLNNAGFPLQSVPATQFRLYHNGKQTSVYTSTNGLLGSTDFIEFYGQKNRSELDSFLFDNPAAEMLNPWYSLFNDTAAYYLTWETTGTPLRIAAQTNDLNNLPPKEAFCWFQLESVFQQAHFKRNRSSETTLSWFDGEGFHRGLSASSPIAMNPVKLFSAGPPATGMVRYACNLGGHDQRIKLRLGNQDTLLFEDQFQDFQIVEHSFQVPQNWLGAQTRIWLESANLADRHALAAVTLRYPRLCDANQAPQFAFSLDASVAPKYLEIANFEHGNSSDEPILFDLDAGYRLVSTVANDTVKILLPPTTLPHRYLLVNAQTGINLVNSLRPVHFQDYSNEPVEYILLSHPALYSDPQNGNTNPVAEYAAYRQSQQGGSFSVANVNILDLYEQFAYGVSYHPLAIRNFAHWAKKHWPNPRFLFLVGKGLHYDLMRAPAAAQAYADSLFFLPVFGNPGTDQLFVTGNRAEKPIIPIGRLAATKASEVSDYLQKVKDYEAQFSAAQTIADAAWKKKILHLSGGQGFETNTIRNALAIMEDRVEQSRLGADVRTFYKTSNAPVESSTFENILHEVDEGAAMLTLFGHSAPQVVDFDIGTPSNYNNQGRYPMMFIMGCFSGVCATPVQGLGEQFVLAKDRGAIAFFAFSNYGLLESLRVYGDKFYEKIGSTEYGKSIGEQLANTAESLQNTADLGMVSLLHQLVLQGDPAIRTYASNGPDYVVDARSAVLSPNPIAIETGKFTLEVEVVNLGENTSTPLAIHVQQRYPNDTLRTLFLDTITAPGFRRSLHYEVDAPGREALGFNRLFVTVDPANAVAETPLPEAEFNNQLLDGNGQAGLEAYFFADDVQPVYPPPYGIVGQAKLLLRASTYQISGSTQRFLFEIDSTLRFNSPLKKAGQVLQSGGLVSWQPSGTFPENTVYYWRVARDSLVGGNVFWHYGSFLFLPGSGPGWNQSHPFQFTDNQFSNLGIDSLTQNWSFSANAAFGAVSVDWLSNGRFPGIQNSYYEGFTGYGGFVSKQIRRGVVVALLDPLTGHFQQNPIGSPTNPSPLFPLHFHHFDTNDSLKRVALMNFLQQGIPDGWYVALLALKNPAQDSLGFSPEKWAADSLSYGTNLFQLLEQRGARQVRNLQTLGSKPYGLIFRQNDPSFQAVDTVVLNPIQAVELRRNFLAKWSSGEMETVTIGPASAWGSLQWEHAVLDAVGESLQVSVVGLRENMPDTLLYVLENETETSLTALSANVFPYLKLQVSALDTVQRSMPAIAKLRVLYEPIPEGAMHPAAGLLFHNDTLQQGDRLRAAIVFENIGQSGMDSLLLRFRLENDQNLGLESLQRVKPLAIGDTLWARFEADTRLLSGRHRLTLEANPANDQPEQQHFNNVFIQDFSVVPDRANPILDVTFDGLHIFQGDLVSAQPFIVVTLRDENKFLKVSDTSTFSLTLTHPDNFVENITWNDPRVLFLPVDAGDNHNKARFEFRPVFTQDGTYQLRVNGRDASGNLSGMDYETSFRVVTRSSFGNVLNYPNPFSTSTCFVYTLTGGEIPSYFSIQIMTVSGKVVREITASEFGPMYIGTHQSSFCWDGTDQFGDRLANGVYLYRVSAKKADRSNFELMGNDSVDGFFKNGIGKMVLMR